MFLKHPIIRDHRLFFFFPLFFDIVESIRLEKAVGPSEHPSLLFFSKDDTKY